MISKKGQIKTNRLYEMVRSIPQTIPLSDNEALKIADISMLQSQDNPDLMISARVVCPLDKGSEVPLCLLIVDYKHNFCVVSIYHMTAQLRD